MATSTGDETLGSVLIPYDVYPNVNGDDRTTRVATLLDGSSQLDFIETSAASATLTVPAGNTLVCSRVRSRPSNILNVSADNATIMLAYENASGFNTGDWVQRNGHIVLLGGDSNRQFPDSDGGGVDVLNFENTRIEALTRSGGAWIFHGRSLNTSSIVTLDGLELVGPLSIQYPWLADWVNVGIPNNPGIATRWFRAVNITGNSDPSRWSAFIDGALELSTSNRYQTNTSQYTGTDAIQVWFVGDDNQFTGTFNTMFGAGEEAGAGSDPDATGGHISLIRAFAWNPQFRDSANTSTTIDDVKIRFDLSGTEHAIYLPTTDKSDVVANVSTNGNNRIINYTNTGFVYQTNTSVSDNDETAGIELNLNASFPVVASATSTGTAVAVNTITTTELTAIQAAITAGRVVTLTVDGSDLIVDAVTATSITLQSGADVVLNDSYSLNYVSIHNTVQGAEAKSYTHLINFSHQTLHNSMSSFGEFNDQDSKDFTADNSLNGRAVTDTEIAPETDLLFFDDVYPALKRDWHSTDSVREAFGPTVAGSTLTVDRDTTFSTTADTDYATDALNIRKAATLAVGNDDVATPTGITTVEGTASTIAFDWGGAPPIGLILGQGEHTVTGDIEVDFIDTPTIFISTNDITGWTTTGIAEIDSTTSRPNVLVTPEQAAVLLSTSSNVEFQIVYPTNTITIPAYNEFPVAYRIDVTDSGSTTTTLVQDVIAAGGTDFTRDLTRPEIDNAAGTYSVYITGAGILDCRIEGRTYIESQIDVDLNIETDPFAVINTAAPDPVLGTSFSGTEFRVQIPSGEGAYEEGSVANREILYSKGTADYVNYVAATADGMGIETQNNLGLSFYGDGTNIAGIQVVIGSGVTNTGIQLVGHRTTADGDTIITTAANVADFRTAVVVSLDLDYDSTDDGNADATTEISIDAVLSSLIDYTRVSSEVGTAIETANLPDRQDLANATLAGVVTDENGDVIPPSL